MTNDELWFGSGVYINGVTDIGINDRYSSMDGCKGKRVRNE